MNTDTRTVTLTPAWWMPFILLLAVTVGGAFFVYGKNAEGRDRTPPMISVTGEGKTSAAPDIAELTFGFQAQRQPSAKIAMDLLGRNMQKVLEAVKKAGVADKDITTESLTLNPAYDWTNGTQVMRGFDAGQSLRVKVRNLDSVSDVLAAATNAGANQAGGVSFVLDDPEKARAEARQKAIAQAQSKAVTLAKQLGMSLGPIKSFNEGGGYSPPMPYGRGGGAVMLESDAAANQAPIPAGEQEVNVQVSLTYELR